MHALLQSSTNVCSPLTSGQSLWVYCFPFGGGRGGVQGGGCSIFSRKCLVLEQVQRVFHSYTSHKESHTITVQPWAVNTIAFVIGREV